MPQRNTSGSALPGTLLFFAIAILLWVPAHSRAEHTPLCNGEPATIVGTPGDDLLTGTRGRDVIVGGDGNDSIRGGGGADVICGGKGDDEIWGASGADVILGGPGADTLHGGPGANDLRGQGGPDLIDGGGGPDTIRGGTGDDIVLAGRGADIVYGEAGDDHLDGHGGPDLLDGGAGADTIRGGTFDDVLIGGTGIDQLAGGPGKDAISGGGHADLLMGEAGDDTLVGEGDNDRLYGGMGDDLLSGGSGTDTTDGGVGFDACSETETSYSCERHNQSETTWLGGTHATRFGPMMKKALVFQTGCDTPLDLERAGVVALALPSSARVPLLRVLSNAIGAAAHCDGDGDAWAAEMEAANIDLAGYVGLVAPPARPGINPARRAREAAVATVLLNDALYDRLRGGGEGNSEFWLSFSHYGHARDLYADAVGGTAYDVLFVGSSMMADAGEPRLFTTRDGRSAFNGGFKGVGPEKIDIWVREFAVDRADPALVIYGTSPRDYRTFTNNPGSCMNSPKRMLLGRSWREQAFEPVAALAGLPWETIFFDDPPDRDPTPTPLAHRLYRANYHLLGDRKVYPYFGPTGGASLIIEWAPNYQICLPRIETMQQTVVWLRSRGIDVVVVALPISDARSSVFGGRSVVDGILDQAEQAAIAAGATAYIDLSRSVPDSSFRDISHVTATGASIFTGRLVDELADLGI